MGYALFREGSARSSRLTMMLAGAVLIHLGIVCVGTWHWRREAPVANNETPYLDVPIESIENVREIPISYSTPTYSPELNEAPPLPEQPVADEPPPVDVPDMTPPAQPRRPTSAMVRSSRTTAPTTSAAPPASNASGGSVGGALGSSGASLRVWNTPKPTYPRLSLGAREQGSTTVRITTDASGNVVTVVIVHSAGSPALDRHTQDFVREHWKGPPNSERTTEFVYQLR